MSKYNVGDKVKVREDLVMRERYGSEIFVDDMAEFKGKEVTIKSVYDCNEEYRIKEMGFTWTNDMFEGLVAKEVKSGFKVGDKVELASADYLDRENNLRVGDIGVVVVDNSKYGYCRILFPTTTMDLIIYNDQIKLVQPQLVEETIEEPTQSIPNKGTIKYRITDDGITYTTLNGSKTGKSIKSGKDESSNEIGILIATARALGFDEDKIGGIVDVLFDDDSYDSKAKCDNAIMKNDIARALSILDRYKEV